jgi:hypothetical protein
MSVAALDEQRLNELYGRYKALALAAGARLVLDEAPESLSGEVGALVADCHAAAASAPGALAPQLAACLTAAEGLGALVGDSPPTEADVEAARATHKQLRSEVWKVIRCEYVPCCASPRHEDGPTGEGNG